MNESLATEIAMFEHGLENPIANGMTTCVFNNHEDENKVLCVTIDRVKIKYMKSAKLPGFKILLETENSFLYEMDKLIQLDEPEEDFLMEKIDTFNSSLNDLILDFKDETKNEFILIKNLFGEALAQGLKSVYSKVKPNGIYLDIHEQQFLKDKNNNLHCVDAVMDINVLHEIQGAR